ncbi:GlxA family transcriptional regulator [Methylobacterium longum]|jgi:transcriptional regulator GlxA family with amidase domain|uniref:GlxA family transcriptional regulator n=1 Tax=Methylobacterium longum TaxID=767694 RepID=A0ABT8AZN6_9HYPH|nr:GlxA family transcriptional regulator [Methylobacterium longum]MDN3574693.1 GlxA family transcriptional regulator [Methylobacterium longum]GJE13616.1 HTH-type transcriptional regulator CdhR [Methylobacterium longum]
MAGVRCIGFLLCPDFDFMGLAVTSPFAVANRYVADTTYDIRFLSEAGGLVRSGCGPAVETQRLSEPSAFDTIIVAAGISLPESSPDFLAYLRQAARSARRLAGLCLGAFAVADAGLLDGRRATTHWRYAPQFRARYPDCALDIGKIYVADGNIWTSAGMSAGIDLAVGMVEADHGRHVARTVARGLVMERRRAGGQAQHSAMLDFDAPSDRIQSVLAYARQNLRRPLTTEDLAAVACLSPRQFTRAFRAETGVSPAKAIEVMRVEAAKHMLEQSRLPIEEIAGATGFAHRERMRRAFLRVQGEVPRAIRRAAGPLAVV